MINTINNILTEEFGLDETNIKNNETLESMDVDSIVMIEIQFELEKVFDIEVKDGDIHSAFTPADLVKYVSTRKAANA